MLHTEPTVLFIIVATLMPNNYLYLLISCSDFSSEIMRASSLVCNGLHNNDSGVSHHLIIVTDYLAGVRVFDKFRLGRAEQLAGNKHCNSRPVAAHGDAVFTDRMVETLGVKVPCLLNSLEVLFFCRLRTLIVAHVRARDDENIVRSLVFGVFGFLFLPLPPAP